MRDVSLRCTHDGVQLTTYIHCAKNNHNYLQNGLENLSFGMKELGRK